MGSSDRAANRFSCSTSRFLLPTFRRPNYRDVKEVSSEIAPANETFFTWTKEEGQLYNVVNTALLNDDHAILEDNVQFVNSLRSAIRDNDQKQATKVYRGLRIRPEDVAQEYKEGLHFLWPTFTCTSRNEQVARNFGNYVFEVDLSPNDGTYRADIAQYSQFPYEEEMLFYPYSGFVVHKIMHDSNLIQLRCVDTLQVEQFAGNLIPDEVKLFDADRNIFVYLYKKSGDAKWCYADKPSEIFIIAEHGNGYWDAPYRYHHRQGYFVDKGQNVWEEYHDHQLFGKFTRIEGASNSDSQSPPGDGEAAKRVQNFTLSCKGAACNDCRKCRDWCFTGDQDTWNWLSSYGTWKDSDWDRWNKDGIAKRFVKNDGAACLDAVDRDDAVGSARYLTYLFLTHTCFCDLRAASGTSEPAQNPCKVQ